MRLFLLVTLVGLVIFSGCKKEWLEAKVDEKLAVPTTIKDFQAMLDNFSSINKDEGCIVIAEVASDGHVYSNSDFNLMAPSYFQFQNAYSWSDISPYQSISGYVFTYSTPYNSILNMNIILNGIEKSKDQNIKELGNIKGQALFHRGRLFFELAQTFASPYSASTVNSDLGIALRLSTDIIEPSKRSTIKETYDQIISDLVTAKDNLDVTPQFLTRASKPAALAMLARVYLSIGDYENAFKYSDEYLKIKSDLLDYNTISSSANFIGVNKEINFLYFLYPFTQLTSQYFIEQSLYDSYDNNDLRKQIFFKVSSAGISFKGTYGNSPTDIFAGISTDEIYLIRAECSARKGDLTSAMKDLNDLLKTRWAKNIDGSTKYANQSAINEFDALSRIFSERKKQLILRGVRWTDLRRLNQDPRFAITLKRTIGGKDFELEPNSYRFTFPFPIEVIQRSSMAQNPGWQ